VVSATVRVMESGEAMGRALARDLDGARSVSIAVAFAKPSAWSAVDLRAWCRDDRSLRLVAGTDFEITDLDVLRDLGARPNAQCKVMHSAARAATAFHPKLYLIERERSVVAFVGSSNLTLGGLGTNVEANVRIEGEPDAAPIVEARRAFESYFEHELATVLSPEFAARYEELRALRARARTTLYEVEEPAREHLRVAENLLLGDYRARVANKRWLLVTSAENYRICMQHGTWGRKNEREARACAPGDVFFMHVTEGGGVRAMGMFTGEPYFDDVNPLWRDMDGKGAFPWRIRFVPLGELRVGIPTKAVLEPLHAGAAKNWFHGFIQASHSLDTADFDALRAAFEPALRADRGLGGDRG
jgi:HKD family nuclease